MSGLLPDSASSGNITSISPDRAHAHLERFRRRVPGPAQGCSPDVFGLPLTNGIAVGHCAHCKAEVDARAFRLNPTDATRMLCPNRACGRSFEWKRQNKNKLWPEQRAYSVLR